MIERVVLVKLKDSFAHKAARTEIIAHTRKTLPQIPGVVSASVGEPADPRSEESWDMGIVVRFQTMDQVPTYISHPDHRTYVDDYLRPRMEVIKAWNFQID